MAIEQDLDPNAPETPPESSSEFDPNELSAALQYYADFIKQHGIETWGQAQDGYNAYIAQRRQGKTHDEALQGGLSMLGWDKATKQPDNPVSGGVDPGGGGGGGYAPGGLLTPYDGTFTPPSNPYPGQNGTGVPDLPEFTPPEFTKPPAFAAPTLADAQSEPGYEFARGEGLRALKQHLAKQGTISSGAAGKGLFSWADAFANQNYGNVFNRQKTVYDTNAETQYFRPYELAYRSALDAYQPKLLEYSTTAAANQRGNELNYSNAWDRYLQQYRQFRDQRGDTLGAAFSYFGM